MPKLYLDTSELFPYILILAVLDIISVMSKVTIFLLAFMLLQNQTNALVVAPLFAIPIIKITVAIVSMLSIPAAGLTGRLKKATKKTKLVIFLAIILVLWFATYAGLMVYQSTITIDTNTSHINIENLLLKFVVFLFVGLVPVIALEYFNNKNKISLKQILVVSGSFAAIATVVVTILQSYLFI